MKPQEYKSIKEAEIDGDSIYDEDKKKKDEENKSDKKNDEDDQEKTNQNETTNDISDEVLNYNCMSIEERNEYIVKK